MRGSLFDAVLFDRDGTLVHDVPHNRNPAAVRPVAGAATALDRLRRAGLKLGVVTNQPGLAEGRFTPAELVRVHARLEALLGRFDTWQVCGHTGQDACGCRKPAPGLIEAAARELGTVPRRCVVVGDTGRDTGAAAAAGAAGVLVPTAVTRTAEVAAAQAVAGDLHQAVDLILRRQRLVTVGPPRRAGSVLVARADSAGDVLVTGPAIRAVAAGARRVVLLCGPHGRAAAELLPGVDELIEARLPWIDPHPEPAGRALVERLAARVAAAGVEQAVIFTSYHQSPLPLALVLRMAGVGRISAISDDYPGSLLDVRHRVPQGIPEPERALSLAAAAGFPLPPGDEPVLKLRSDAVPAPPAGTDGGFLVVHPGASVPARSCPPQRCGEIVTALAATGRRVLVTGAPSERALTARVAGRAGVDLGGRTTLAGLAALLARADCLVAGNTGPAHLAAAVGTPVVSLFAPTVPYGQWAPWRVSSVRLGDATAACRHTRATHCPVPGHPCLSTVDPAAVVRAVDLLAGAVR